MRKKIGVENETFKLEIGLRDAMILTDALWAHQEKMEKQIDSVDRLEEEKDKIKYLQDELNKIRYNQKDEFIDNLIDEIVDELESSKAYPMDLQGTKYFKRKGN